MNKLLFIKYFLSIHLAITQLTVKITDIFTLFAIAFLLNLSISYENTGL